MQKQKSSSKRKKGAINLLWNVTSRGRHVFWDLFYSLSNSLRGKPVNGTGLFGDTNVKQIDLGSLFWRPLMDFANALRVAKKLPKIEFLPYSSIKSTYPKWFLWGEKWLPKMEEHMACYSMVLQELLWGAAFYGYLPVGIRREGKLW